MLVLIQISVWAWHWWTWNLLNNSWCVPVSWETSSSTKRVPISVLSRVETNSSVLLCKGLVNKVDISWDIFWWKPFATPLDTRTVLCTLPCRVPLPLTKVKQILWRSVVTQPQQLSAVVSGDQKISETSETASWTADNVLMEAWVMHRQRKHQVRHNQRNKIKLFF